MKSKFRYWAFLVAALSAFFFGMLFMVLTGNVLNPNMSLGAFLCFSSFFCFVWIWLVFGELRTKVVAVEFDSYEVTVIRYLGLFASKTYRFEKIEGYRLSILPSKSGDYEYLYLIYNGRKIIKLSEFYHLNYKELKRAVIERRIKSLGFEHYNFFTEVKEIFN